MGPWGAVIGAVAGGVAGGITAYLNNSKRADAYQDAANAIRDATEKYSGSAAYNDIVQKGSQEGRFQANAFGLGNTPITGNLSMNNVNQNETADIYAQGNSLGRQNEANTLNAKYNAATSEALRDLSQANTEANVQQQGIQAAFNTAGGLADLYKTGFANSHKGE